MGISHSEVVHLNTTLYPPPTESHVICELSNDTVRVTIKVLDDNTLEASIEHRNESKLFTGRTQPVYVARPIPVTLVVWRINQLVSIGIYDGRGARAFPNYDPSNIVPVGIETPDFPKTISLEHPSVALVCKSFVDWRTSRSQENLPVRANNRPASRSEQVRQLQDAIDDVASHCEGVLNGSRTSLKYLSGELRGLLYWKEKSERGWQNYNPLLFRMANLVSLPLPVFAVRELQLPTWANTIEKYQFVLSRSPTLTMEHLDDELMDFQDWLQQVAVVEKPERTDVQPENRTVKGIISLASVAFGGSHYDQDVPQDLDLLVSFTQEDRNGLAHFLGGIGQAVVGLGKYVIVELQKSQLT